jgi:GC-rich sequence DNA-binding factor
VPTARPLPTITPAQSRLANSLAQLSVTKSHNEHALETNVRDLAALEEQEIDLRKEVERVEGKREWVEEFRGWIEMLGRFLEEKVSQMKLCSITLTTQFPKLEAIEADALHHYRERAEMSGKRRTTDDLDDLALTLGVAPPPADEPEEVDELGRSKPSEAGPHSGVRRARRTARESRRGKRKQRASGEDEGFSTDSTLAEGDAEDYFAAHQQLEKRVHGLLDDVRAEDFRDPEKGVAVKFGGWRKHHEEEYVNAFGGLALVHAWEFWARGEMVGWEPLRVSSLISIRELS